MDRELSLSDAMGHWIAQNNIAQFKRQIEVETDESLRNVLIGLLEREEVKLNKALSPL